MKETLKAKVGTNRPGKELKKTGKAEAGANWPIIILKKAVKPTPIPDPQDHPCIAEILMTMMHQDTIGPGRNHLWPDLRRKTPKKALIITSTVCGFINQAPAETTSYDRRIALQTTSAPRPTLLHPHLQGILPVFLSP
jgi:hypothetical protein